MGRVVDRPLSNRERDVLLFLAAGNDATASALRRQIEVARVIVEADCCASFHLVALPEDAPDAPARGWPLTIQATVKDAQQTLVRLITSGQARLAQVEVTHDGEPVGPEELPEPDTLTAPTWWDWKFCDDGSATARPWPGRPPTNDVPRPLGA